MSLRRLPVGLGGCCPVGTAETRLWVVVIGVACTSSWGGTAGIGAVSVIDFRRRRKKEDFLFRICGGCSFGVCRSLLLARCALRVSSASWTLLSRFCGVGTSRRPDPGSNEPLLLAGVRSWRVGVVFRDPKTRRKKPGRSFSLPVEDGMLLLLEGMRTPEGLPSPCLEGAGRAPSPPELSWMCDPRTVGLTIGWSNAWSFSPRPKNASGARRLPLRCMLCLREEMDEPGRKADDCGMKRPWRGPAGTVGVGAASRSS